MLMSVIGMMTAKEAPLIDLIMKENSKLEEVIGKELANRKAIAEICKSYSKLSISQSLVAIHKATIWPTYLLIFNY